MNYLAYFFAGAFISNCLPHLVAGVLGMPFPTPFAKPSGVGDSSPLVNFLWGSLNLMVGVCLLSWRPVVVGINAEFATLALGFMLLGIFTSLHFGKVRQGRIKN